MTQLLTAFFFASAATVNEPASELRDEDDVLSAEQLEATSTTAIDAWLEVLRDGIELTHTTREELNNVPGLSEQDVNEVLVAQHADTPRQQTALAPFLRATDGMHGHVRLLTQFSSADLQAPPALIDARVQGPWGLSAGVLAMTTRQAVDTPRASTLKPGALETNGFGYHLQLPRLFLRWQTERLQLIAGTFTIGFAERLTLDTTRRLFPNGIALSDSFRRPNDLSRSCKLSGAEEEGPACPEGHNRYVTADFDVRDAFRGFAASLDNVALSESARFAATAFISYQARSPYQYELLDLQTCRELKFGCPAPAVFLSSTGTRVVFSTLPFFYDELTGGAHAAIELFNRFHFGVTGFANKPFFHQSDNALELAFQPWSRHANGLSGAFGVDGRAQLGEVTIHFEAARSFDQSQGGGFGVIERTIWRQLELSLRYYDAGFSNSFARPVSAPDEYDGQRARNELGARLTLYFQLAAFWRLFTRADFWVLPFTNPRVGPAGMASVFALARIDFTGSTLVMPGLWVETRNRNVASSEHGRCASGTVIFTEGQPFDCSGDLYRAAIRFEAQLASTITVTAQSLLTLSDDRKYRDRFRIDFQQWLEAHGRPAPWLQWHVRVRYLNQDLEDHASLEESIWSFIELAVLPLDGVRVAARYDSYVWLDDRNVTRSRTPNPEHRFSFDLRSTF